MKNVLTCSSMGTSQPSSRLQECMPVPLQEESAHQNAGFSTLIEAEVIELFRLHAAALSRFAATLTRDGMIAQDGIQETFLRYFRARIDGLRLENPRAWLFRVLRNYLLDRRRRSNCMIAVDLEAAGHLADFRQDVEAKYLQDETLRRAVSSLSPREQECLQLRLEGFGYEEISQVLRIRPGTVAALLARGLKKIRETEAFLRRQ